MRVLSLKLKRAIEAVLVARPANIGTELSGAVHALREVYESGEHFAEHPAMKARARIELRFWRDGKVVSLADVSLGEVTPERLRSGIDAYIAVDAINEAREGRPVREYGLVGADMVQVHIDFVEES